jgi:hypothetical protein
MAYHESLDALGKSPVFSTTWWQNSLYVSACAPMKSALMYAVVGDLKWGGKALHRACHGTIQPDNTALHSGVDF